MGLTKFLNKIFGGKENSLKTMGDTTDTTNYLTSNPDKKLKVRTVDATQDARNLARNTLNTSAIKASKPASKAKNLRKESENKSLEKREIIFN